MPKEKWAHADEIEKNPKTPLDPSEINAESFTLPVLSLELGETESEEELVPLVDTFLDQNPELKDKVESENLDIVAHDVSKSGSRKKWVLIIGFGFAALGLGIAGYKLIKKHKSKKP